MRRSRSLSRLSLLSSTLAALFCLPSTGAAQVDSTAAHATLRGWNEQMWLTVFDRAGNIFGRTSDRGILQRFNARMDSEYQLDFVSYFYSLREVYTWYQADSGVRFWTGSIDHLNLIQQGDFRAAVPLGDTWSLDAWFRYEQTLEADRSLLTARFRHQTFGGRGEFFLLGTIPPVKADADLELGFNWSIAGGVITAAVGALDVFSDLIYQDLEVPANIADTTFNYTAQPFSGRVALDLPLGRRFRLEGYGLVMTPTRFVAESRSDPGGGFAQDERFGYAGGLLEWTPSYRSAVGGIATWVASRVERTRLPAGQAEDDFDLEQATYRLGVYGLHRFSDRFELEAWLTRIWRSEERIRPDTAVAPNVDYEDRAWAGRSTLTYRAGSGFRADLGFDLLARDISKGALVPRPEVLGRDNARIRLGVGWHFGKAAYVLVGFNLDVDSSRLFGGEDGTFDGAYGRFSLYW
jgi:hypothetical protein